MSHRWFHNTSLLPPSASPAPARQTGARQVTPPPASRLSGGWYIFPWLRVASLAARSTLGGAWKRVLATLRWPRLSLGGRRGIPIEVLVSNDSERRTLERQLRVTLHKLRGALHPLPSGRRVALVVQHSLGAEVPLASRCDARQDAGGTVLYLIRLALHVHGRALPTDEVLAQLADRYVALAFGADPSGASADEAETPASGSAAVDTGLTDTAVGSRVADPVPAVPVVGAASSPLTATGSVADGAPPAAEEASPREPGPVPAAASDAVPQPRSIPTRRASRPPARSSATRSPAVATALVDPLGLRKSPPAPLPIGTPAEGADAPVPPGADATPGATVAGPAATERPARRDRSRRRQATD